MQKQIKKTTKLKAIKPKKLVGKLVLKKSPAVEEEEKVRPNSPLQGPHKTFQQDGHWIEKPNKTAILICVCGNRYLKTRPRQEKCLRCVSATFTLRK